MTPSYLFPAVHLKLPNRSNPIQPHGPGLTTTPISSATSSNDLLHRVTSTPRPALNHHKAIKFTLFFNESTNDATPPQKSVTQAPAKLLQNHPFRLSQVYTSNGAPLSVPNRGCRRPPPHPPQPPYLEHPSEPCTGSATGGAAIEYYMISTSFIKIQSLQQVHANMVHMFLRITFHSSVLRLCCILLQGLLELIFMEYMLCLIQEKESQ